MMEIQNGAHYADRDRAAIFVQNLYLISISKPSHTYPVDFQVDTPAIS